MKCLVIKHTYQTKVTEVIKSFDSIQNASLFLEESVIDYVTQYMGTNIKVHNRHHLNSRYWNNADYGYLLMKNTEESLYKLTILLKKKINGYLYNTYKMIPLYYYEIVYMDENKIEYTKDYLYEEESSDEEIDVELETTKKVFMDELEDQLIFKLELMEEEKSAKEELKKKKS